jgi:hypothetical protein
VLPGGLIYRASGGLWGFATTNSTIPDNKSATLMRPKPVSPLGGRLKIIFAPTKIDARPIALTFHMMLDL